MRYNYRLYPNHEQQQLMVQIMGQQRFVWNHFLGKEIERYKETKKFNFYNLNAGELPALKKEFEWLKMGPSQSLQQTLRDLNNALITSCKNKDRGFPRFKKRKEFEGSFRVVQTGSWKFTRKFISIPKVGDIKWALHRDIPSSFSTATIFLDGDNWFVSLVVDRKEAEPVDVKSIVGLDLNSKDLVVTSDGECFKNQKYLKKYSKKLKKIQRQFAKTKKDSNRRNRKQLQLRKCYKKITNCRKDTLHKISSQIVNDYDLISIENLNVKGMQKFNGSMVQDAGWSILTSMLTYKAKLYGKHIVKIDRFDPSSKACNNCGEIKKALKLSDRTYNCDQCGIEIDRDFNAALNIRDWGIWKHTDGTSGINGRGDTAVGDSEQSGSRYVSLNRQKFLVKNQEAGYA